MTYQSNITSDDHPAFLVSTIVLYAYVNLWNPKMSQLKKMINCLLDLKKKEKEFQQWDEIVVRNILLFICMKYFKYDQYKQLIENERNGKSLSELFGNIQLENINERILPYLEDRIKLSDGMVHYLYHTKRVKRDENSDEEEFFFKKRIDLRNINACNIVNIDEKKYLKITYNDNTCKYFYYDETSSIDHIISYKNFEDLKEFLDYDIIEYYAQFNGVI